MGTCLYCGIGPSRTAEQSLWIDVAARGLAVVRTVAEMRAADRGMREIAAHLVGRDDAPELDAPRTRLCPYCRKTHLTALAENTLWFDFGTRLLGISRSYVLARGQGLRGLALALVEGDDAGVEVDTEVYRVHEGSEVYTPKREKQAPKRRRPRGWGKETQHRNQDQ